MRMDDIKIKREKQYANLVIKELGNSELEITGDIPVEAVRVFRKKAIASFGKNVQIDGFRKGHVPEDVVVGHVGEAHIMQEAAELALADVYPAIVFDRELDVVGRPNVTITKLAPENPIGFSIKTAVMPKFDLPDYASIAKRTREKSTDPDTVTISEEELEKAVLEVRKRAAQHAHAHSDDEEEDEESEHEHEHKDIPESELPPLTDESVKAFGPFEKVDDFKKVLREQMKREKETQEREKLRLALVGDILEKTSMTIPALFADSELDKMVVEFKNTLSRMGLTLEQYLEKNAMTPEKLRDEWRPEAEKRAKIDLLLSAVAKKEELKADPKKVELETGHLLAYYKDADPVRIRDYVDHMLVNEEVFRFLEGKKKEDIK